jgi:hypothetical protein
LFDRLDTDKDGSLSIRELQGRLSSKDFSAADPDKDKTLTKDEYLTVSNNVSKRLMRTVTAP